MYRCARQGNAGKARSDDPTRQAEIDSRYLRRHGTVLQDAVREAGAIPLVVEMLAQAPTAFPLKPRPALFATVLPLWPELGARHSATVDGIGCGATALLTVSLVDRHVHRNSDSMLEVDRL